MSKDSVDEEIINKNDHSSLPAKVNDTESTEDSSLLNSIVDAVMRGDMNQVVTLALSHRSSDQKVKNMVDQALSSAISNKARLIEKSDDEIVTNDSDLYSHSVIKSSEDVAVVESSMTKSPVSKKHNSVESALTSQNVLYSQKTQTKSSENEVPCTYYYSNDSMISSNCTNIDSNGNAVHYCQSGYATHNTDLENHNDDSVNNSLSQYHITNSSLQNVESINSLSISQQSVQVQLPGIGNFLLQIPSNFKPGEPITLPLNLPLTPVSQTPGVNPISIHMNTGQLLSNPLLSLYNPSSNINIAAGKKMRAIAPKPSKPTYRQPLIAPKTNSPNISSTTQDSLSINSTPLPAPSGPGRRKGNKGKKSGRKRGAPAKSHKNSSYASSTHSMDSQDATQFNETTGSLKQNSNNSISTRSTYQCNYYVNNDSSDYLNQPHVTISQSFNEMNSNTLLDNSDSGEKDLLSLAWEISNAELGNNDDFATAYNLYDANNLGADGFVSSEILDQFLQNIQKDEIVELTRCSTTQINVDSRVSYASSFTTLPPCSTVLPSVTTSTYLNNYSNNSSNIELPQCIEIAEVVNLNTEDMLTELEKEENALLDKFVAQYGTAHQNELIRCDSQTVIPISMPTSSDCTMLTKINENGTKESNSTCQTDLSNEDSEKELDLNIKESNELSEIAKQIEISCNSSHQDVDRTVKSKIYTICDNSENQNKLDCFTKIIDNSISETNFSNNTNNTLSFVQIPNRSIELIYSSTSEASLIDEKAQCLMSFNFDSKRPSDSFYITDSNLKSKTLDDFGLFEFCADGEISLNVKTLNQESVDIITDDDNKYIEPPILEDISDATPIQSDNESEDEDINEKAFKFSKFNFLTTKLEKKDEEVNVTPKLYYHNLIKDPLDLNYFQNNKTSEIRSDEWYIGINKISIPDIFVLKENSEIELTLTVNKSCFIQENNITKSETNINDINFSQVTLTCDNLNTNTENEKNHNQSEPNICNTKMDFQKPRNNTEIVLSQEIDVDIESDLIIHNDVEQNKEQIMCFKSFHKSGHQKDSDVELIESLKFKNSEIKIQNLKEKLNCEQETKEELLSYDKKHRKEIEINCMPSKNLNEFQNDGEIIKGTDFQVKSTISNIQNRQRRLRKPPKKLAIYQSINFIEKEFSTDSIKKITNKKKFITSDDPKLSADFKRCTRSKGTISKSFDSFYEAISRHHKMSSNSKRKISPKINCNENLFISNNCKTDKSKDHMEIINNKDNLKTNKDNLFGSVDNNSALVSQALTNTSDIILTSDHTADYLSNKFIASVSGSCLNRLKKNYKNPNIIRKYNLRTNSSSLKHEDQIKPPKSSKSQFIKCKTSEKKIIGNVKLKAKNKLNSPKIKYEIHDSNLEISIKNAVIQHHIYEYSTIDFHLSYFECKCVVTEIETKLLFPSLTIQTILTPNVVENKQYVNNNFEINVKKSYPVRKINKKLRLHSGLEAIVNYKNVKYGTVVDFNSIEIPNRFQCCTQFARVSSIQLPVNFESYCNTYIPESFYPEIVIQNFNSNDDPLMSDTDDVESLDAPLVIVEIEDVSDHLLPGKNNNHGNVSNEKKTDENHMISKGSQSTNYSSEILIEKSELCDIPKTYSLRPKNRQTDFLKRSPFRNKDFISQKIRRPLCNRKCKKSERYSSLDHDTFIDNTDLINNINLRTPICAIEKLSHKDIMANLYTSSTNTPETKETNSEKLSVQLKDSKTVNVFRKIKIKVMKKPKNNVYKFLKKSIWRRNINRISNSKSRLKKKSIMKHLQNYTDISNLDKNVKLIEEGIAHIIIESKDFNKDIVDIDDNESINVENNTPKNQFNTYLDSNNVETFSRNYGSFSLKIKVQKKDPLILESFNVSKKHKKNSKRRKRLRHFLSSIIGSDDGIHNKLQSSEDTSVFTSKINESNYDIKRKNRKRKYNFNREVYNDAYSTNDELRNYLGNDRSPQLPTESRLIDDYQHRKPIKIKLFKSTNEDLNKSECSSFNNENIVFSLQKSDHNDIKEYSKTANQKILQIMQDLPLKPCRQAANLAKKKIFSTAKEDRRSQNATLTSIWNSKKPNNGNNKVSTDILTMYQNEKGKRPRGRPPKLGQSLFISEKQASSTGTLKLKIKLSKDFKNCNNDSQSSNGENSGRTSTNDSSILNSAVAGINGPSDALSLESNNFINGITEQLDQNIEYLEAKEAKVYFDPNQVDIERIKNSYYSSKKINSESFNIELHQRLIENSVTDISNKKSDIISNNRNFSQYTDLEPSEVNNIYNSRLAKESNGKLSHLPKENITISENCYTNVIANREPQNLSQTSQSFQFENQLSPEKNPPEVWQNSKTSSDSMTPCRNNTNSWFSDHRSIRDSSFQNSNSILYNTYMTSPVKETKSCIGQNQNTPFVVCENENSDPKLIQRSPSKRSGSTEGRKSGSNSFSINESHNQLSPHYTRGGINSVSSQLNIHPWSDDPNHNTSLNHTAAAWMTYAQQQAAAAYMDPQMKAYYNLALSQSMLNNPYCGSYGNPAANSENFYSSLHSQYLNNTKDANEKIAISNSGVRSHNDPMGSFMEAAQMTSWEHFYSAAAMAGYHNSSQGAMDDYAGRAGNMLQAHHMLANGYPGSMLGRDHFTLDNNKPPIAHQNQSGTTSPKLTASGSTPVSSSQAYSHVQMPYSHFSGTTVGFF